MRPQPKVRARWPKKKLDVEEAIECLKARCGSSTAPRFEYTLAAGSMVGASAYQHSRRHAVAVRRARARRRAPARREDQDARREPTTDVAPLRYSQDPARADRLLIEDETEAAEALQDCIAPTGREAKSEALEHRLEHMIMRKQEQIDLLERARREPGA